MRMWMGAGKLEQARQPGRRRGHSCGKVALLVMGVAAALSTVLFSRPVLGNIITTKGAPVLNSGSGSTLTQSVDWLAVTSSKITRLYTTTYSINGSNNVTGVTVAGSKQKSTWLGCTVTATVTLKDAAGGTLSSGSAAIPSNTSGTFSVTAMLGTAVYYHRIAATTVAVTQSGGGC